MFWREYQHGLPLGKVVKMGYVYIKKSLHASEQERLRCQEKAGRVEKIYVGERRR